MLKFHFLFVLQFYFGYKLVFGRLLEEITIAQIDEILPNRRNQYFVVKNAKITYSRRINLYEACDNMRTSFDHKFICNKKLERQSAAGQHSNYLTCPKCRKNYGENNQPIPLGMVYTFGIADIFPPNSKSMEAVAFGNVVERIVDMNGRQFQSLSDNQKIELWTYVKNWEYIFLIAYRLELDEHGNEIKKWVVLEVKKKPMNAQNPPPENPMNRNNKRKIFPFKPNPTNASGLKQMRITDYPQFNQRKKLKQENKKGGSSGNHVFPDSIRTQGESSGGTSTSRVDKGKSIDVQKQEQGAWNAPLLDDDVENEQEAQNVEISEEDEQEIIELFRNTVFI